MSRKTSLVFLALVVLATAGPAGAGPPGRWDVLDQGEGAPGISSELGLVATGDGRLHVAWSHVTGSFSADVRLRSISPAGQLGQSATINSGWNSGDPALVLAPGGIRAFFPAGSFSPLVGLVSATAPAAGSPWSAPALVSGEEFAYARTPSVTLVADGTPLETWYTGSQIAVHRGVSPGPIHLLTDGGVNTRPNIATDSSGRVWVTWCRFQNAPLGVLVQQVDGATGAPVGGAFALPGSATEFQGAQNATCVLESVINRRVPIAARVGGGVYVAGTAGYPSQTQVLVWRVDGPGQAATRIVASARGVSHSEPALAAAPDGRIWVGWLEQVGGGSRIVARRSNRAGSVFGAAVSPAAPPGGFADGVINLSAQAGRLDVLALISRPASVSTLQHTQLLPGLSLTSARAFFLRGKRQTIVFRALDAGDPVAGVKVTLGRQSATTNAAGRAAIVIAPNRGVRSLRATATKPGYALARLTLRGR